MTKIQIALNKPYNIEIGRGLLSSVGLKIKELKPTAQKAMIISDTNVSPLYSKLLMKSLKDVGFDVSLCVFSAGEVNKNFYSYQYLLNCAVERRLTRDDVILALGGGVVGDLAGFVASTYLRGIDFVQIPTTLLAGIDSSIGGKTGINIAQGKNLVGAFHQPIAVFFDADTLLSLPDAEWKNGIGEGIKYAVLTGGKIGEILSNGLCENNLEEFVTLCAKAKADIVSADEKESGSRKLLNLGHTLGHAIEKVSKYEISHGEAVAKGVFMIAKASHKAGILSTKDYDFIKTLLEKYGLKQEVKLEKDTLLEAICADKKMNADGEISFVNICGLGDCRIEKTSLKKFGDYVL